MINSKTDWTSDDYYNAEDFNRVEYNTQFIADYLESIGYKSRLEDKKTDRDMTSIDFLNSINRIERNIKNIKNSFIEPPGYENSKTWEVGMGFNFEDANRLEKNLELLHHWAKNTEKEFKYCGEFYVGEEVI